MAFKHIKVPSEGEKIRMVGGRLQVPERPIIPFIEGDGTGPDIWRASQYVFDHAVEKAYGGKRKISWMEVMQARSLTRILTRGYPTKPSTRSANTWSGLKGR